MVDSSACVVVLLSLLLLVVVVVDLVLESGSEYVGTSSNKFVV